MAKRVSVFMCVERTGLTMDVRGQVKPAAFLTARTVYVDDEASAAAKAAKLLRDTMPELAPGAIITAKDQRVLGLTEASGDIGRAFFPDTF
jgi:hypothetical protein